MLVDSRGILFVCTGNICRSPYAERRLRQLMPDSGVSVASAGTAAVVGAQIEQGTSEQLRRRGADVTGFAARSLSPRLLKETELVLTMTRAHRGEVARLCPSAMTRIFSLGDFADLCSSSKSWRPISSSSPWLPQVAVEAAAARGTIAPRDLSEVDVVDPFGASARVLSEACDRIDAFLDVVVTTLGALARSPKVASYR
ncbi:arsenate reductase/protein-tyrosine-phosphatase family protein [Terrabacter sp. 2YAF2]|uniref:arsenate reductase/protein-tyrosine-phosphatase family protein n=1 Tax=Terrabacter sp. 2YAF2 TaxID=3233026 RepID=UPI003F954CBC